MAADALSDVLRTVRLTGATFFHVVARGAWVAEQPPRATILPKLLPGAGHLIAYHAITEGRCFAAIVGREPIAVEAGEVVVFTRGDQHVMSSRPGMRAETAAAHAIDALNGASLPLFVNFGGEGAVSAKLICGFLACDAEPFNPLLDQLPPLMKIGNLGETRWLGELIQLVTSESAERRPGAEGVLARASELMFIEVVRRYLERMPAEQGGWLAGLRDPFVGKALALLHAAPARNWTIEELARKVGVSRSVMAERFADLVGIPPMQYLGKWRMQIASGLLSGGSAGLAEIAAETGYGSEAALSRAFKKIVGVSPSAWRKRKNPPSPPQPAHTAQ